MEVAFWPSKCAALALFDAPVYNDARLASSSWLIFDHPHIVVVANTLI